MEAEARAILKEVLMEKRPALTSPPPPAVVL